MMISNSPPTRNIVLAIDGSKHAMAAIKLIQNLPLPQFCGITLISVMQPRNAHEFGHHEQLLEQAKIKLKTGGVNVETKVLSGNPGEQIVDYATQNHPDLLVLGAKGLRGTLRILLGGVAQQVVEYAPCPVLIVRDPHIQMKHVLLVTDGSEHSQYAIQHLSQCPLPNDSFITALHVLPPEITPQMLFQSLSYGQDHVPLSLPPDVEETLAQRAQTEAEHGENLLHQTGETLHQLGLNFKTVLRRGDSATEILDYAEQNHIDLIIAGSRGLSQVQSWVLGSVSSKLVHYADCSVLVMKKPKP